MKIKLNIKTATALAVASIALLCGGCGYSPVKCRETVVAKYGPNVTPIPNHEYIFVVQSTNGAIYLVETMNWTDTKISSEVQLFGAQK